MKKTVTLLISGMLVLSLTACSSGNKKAFEASKEAYNNINTAYEITENFGSDIYEAWRLAIYEKDEVLDGGTAYLSSELSLSEEELNDGVAYMTLEDEWENATEEQKSAARDSADLYFSLFEDDLFSYCVILVTNAYKANGKVSEAETVLEEAKEQMKTLSEKYSDYEHYPNLKGYYTTTSSFFFFF